MRVAVWVGAMVALGVSIDALPAPPTQLANPVPPAAKSIAAGGQLFQRYCAPCHGVSAKGNGPLAPRGAQPPDLTDAEWTHGASDEEIFTNIRDGIGPKFDMKSMKSRMTATEIWHIVNYLRSIGPQR